jgi:hypothetical protein
MPSRSASQCSASAGFFAELHSITRSIGVRRPSRASPMSATPQSTMPFGVIDRSSSSSRPRSRAHAIAGAVRHAPRGSSAGTQAPRFCIAASFTRAKSSPPSPGGRAGAGGACLRFFALPFTVSSSAPQHQPSGVDRVHLSGVPAVVLAGDGEELPAAEHLDADLVLLERVRLAGDVDVHALARGRVLGEAVAGLDDARPRSEISPVPRSIMPSRSMPIRPSPGRKAKPMPPLPSSRRRAPPSRGLVRHQACADPPRCPACRRGGRRRRSTASSRLLLPVLPSSRTSRRAIARDRAAPAG